MHDSTGQLSRRASSSMRARGSSSPGSEIRRPAATLRLINAAIDCAKARQARPWRELVQTPRLPIRESYFHRLLVNFVWNASNYVVIIFAITLFMCYWFPLFALVFIPAVMLHRVEVGAQRAAWFVVQLACLYINLHFYGALPGLLTTSLCVVVVVGHAVMTPYTDEAMRFIDNLLKTKHGEELPPPRTPVISFVPNLPFPSKLETAGTSPAKKRADVTGVTFPGIATVPDPSSANTSGVSPLPRKQSNVWEVSGSSIADESFGPAFALPPRSPRRRKHDGRGTGPGRDNFGPSLDSDLSDDDDHAHAVKETKSSFDVSGRRGGRGRF